ncbi:MAG: flagellar hook assembly protein FlgD [Hyphomicrobiaceae bacterium]|nr:flagellar hook assembly protein FlgD [Hyphomicrobiaceae bacterium]
MAVSGVGSVGTNAANKAAEAPSANSLDYNAFLQLLLAQMKNQDPTEPMDSTAYMGQLASFSNVEQGMKMNTKLDSLMSAFYLNQADGVIGRTLTTADGAVSGKVMSVSIYSDGAIAKLDNGKQVLLGPGIVIT